MKTYQKSLTAICISVVAMAGTFLCSCSEKSPKQEQQTEQVDTKDLSWLQGYWTCDAPFGKSEIRIFNDSIADLSLGSTQAGKFKIVDGNKLVTDYGIKDYEVSYELDLKNRHIFFGDRKDGKYYIKK